MAEVLKNLGQATSAAAEAYTALYTVPAGKSSIVTLSVQNVTAAIRSWGARLRVAGAAGDGVGGKDRLAFRVGLNYYEHQTAFRGLPMGPGDVLEVFGSALDAVSFGLSGVESDVVGPAKCLAQLATPAGTAARTTLYTVPAAKSALITRIVFCNWNVAAQAYNLLHRKSGEADNLLKQYMLASEPIAPNGVIEWDDPIAMAAGDLLAVSVAGASSSAQAFGYEQAA